LNVPLSLLHSTALVHSHYSCVLALILGNQTAGILIGAEQ
jgi:hypothetical protein